MCGTCGCGGPEGKVIIQKPGTDHSNDHDSYHSHEITSHSHEHDHDHSHSHDHDHNHHHHHTDHHKTVRGRTGYLATQ